MKEMIIRINDLSEDAEIMVYETLLEKETFRAVSKEKLVDCINELINNDGGNKKYNADLIYTDEDMIAYGPNCIVTKQPQHKKIVTYAGKAYKINFPNSVYFICHTNGMIDKIRAFCYKEWKDMQTELYRYAMPNMLGLNEICLGTAKRDIDPARYKDALERVLFAQYTHAYPNNIKDFKSTHQYFKYLSDHEPPYDKMIKTGGTLKREFDESYNW